MTPIKGYEGLFVITDDLKVISLPRKGTLGGEVKQFLNIKNANKDEKEIISNLDNNWTFIKLFQKNQHDFIWDLANVISSVLNQEDLIIHHIGNFKLLIYKNKINNNQLNFIQNLL